MQLKHKRNGSNQFRPGSLSRHPVFPPSERSKMLGLTVCVSDLLQNSRLKELNLSKAYRRITTGRKDLSN